MHTIRLRGPWDLTPLARLRTDDSLAEPGADLPARGTLEMPADWSSLLGDDFRGQVRFTRRFNLPTGLDGNQHVWLVVEEVYLQGRIALNQVDLGLVESGVSTSSLRCPARFDITSLLQPRNEIVIEVHCPPTAERPGSLGLVLLEID